MLQKNLLHDVYLALGTNLGDRNKNIELAVQSIDERIGTVISISTLYETEPVGFDSDNLFLNGACHIQTILDPLEVLEVTQVIERELGRKAKSLNHTYKDRIIDIDILLYDNLIAEYPHLLIPHPHLHKRDFVLLPLADIAANVVHPILNKTISELKTELNNGLI